MFKHILVKRIL